MKKIVFVIGFLCLTSQASEIADRQLFCDDTKTIAKALKDKFQEMPVISGKADDEVNSLMTLWMNPVTETWSIVATHKDFSCIVGTGQNLKVIDYSKKTKI